MVYGKLWLLCMVIVATACNDGKKGNSVVDSGNPDIFTLHLNWDNLQSSEIVDCTLEDGSEAQCYEWTFASNPIANGPYCPENINDIGGVGIYDGDTNPGFQVMKKTLFESMEADGFDIVDEDGNIRTLDPSDPSSRPEPGQGACLEASFDDALKLTFLIPMQPVALSTPNAIESVELVGVSLDGVPIVGEPPSVVGGPSLGPPDGSPDGGDAGGPPSGGGAVPGGNIPALDPCGGHADPAGYYHWHFVAESISTVFDRYGISEVRCENVVPKLNGLVGFAKDGYPIYAPLQEDGEVPSDLDECHGKFGPTAEFPEGIYHYYASKELAPNLPPCLKGVAPEAGEKGFFVGQ